MTSKSKQTRPHLTDFEAEAVLDYLGTIATLIGAPRFRFELDNEPCDDDAYASISMHSQKYHARLALTDEWMDLPVEQRQHIIIHEACHLLHHRLDHLLNDAERFMHVHEHEAFIHAYHRERELIVDQLTATLQDTAAPEWPDS